MLKMQFVDAEMQCGGKVLFDVLILVISSETRLNMKRITLWLSLLLCLLVFETASSQVVVNEVMSNNTNVLTDEDNSYQDWVELYNAGASSVNLNGYGLTDDPASPYKWVIPNITLAPGQYKVIFCSDKNRTNPAGTLHTNWKISNSGETIVLTSGNGSYPNSARCPGPLPGLIPGATGILPPQMPR